MMTDRLKGKIAIVTGSNSDMGQTTAKEFASEGADVAIRLAVYLASEDADYVTGQTFTLAGGLMMNIGQGA